MFCIAGISYFVLVQLWLDFGVGAAVDAELFVGHDVFFSGEVVVSLDGFCPERYVLDEHAGPWVTGP